MFAVTERLTLGAMIRYFRKEMHMVDLDGNHFVMRGKGLGDRELRPEYLIWQTAETAPVASQWRKRGANRHE